MTKKLKASLISILTVLTCFALSLGLWLGVMSAKADETQTVTLSAVSDFLIDETGKFTGLSEQGEEKVASADFYELVIPASVKTFAARTVDGKSVRPIGGTRDNPNTKLVKVSFEEGSECTALGYGRLGLFEYCTALKDADLTNAVKLTSTQYAFRYCSSLEKVIMPPAMYNNATLELGNAMFYQSGIKEFTIPLYVNSIKSSAFSDCYQLETINIAAGHETFINYTDAEGKPYDQAIYTKDENGAPNAFITAPYKMTEITLPQSMVTPDEDNEDISIKLDVLSAIGELQTVVVPENDAVYFYGNALWFKTDVDVHEDDDEGNKYLSYTILAHDVAFIPSGVVELGIPKDCAVIWLDESEIWDSEDASYLWFELYESYRHPNLKAINVQEGNTVYRSYSGVLYSADYSKMLIPDSIEELIIPAAITSFDFSALSDCPELKSITAEEGHTSYVSHFGVLYSTDYSEMFVPQGIEEFTIPAAITNFDFSVLSKCSKLKTINAEAGHTTYAARFGVVYSADYNKVIFVPQDMEELIIPKEANNFDASVLANCSKLKSVIIEEGNTSYISRDGIIYNKAVTELIFVPSTVTEYYVPETLEKIGEYAFAVYDEDGNRIRNQIQKVYITDVEKWARIQFGEPIETAEQYEQFPDGSASKERRNSVSNGLCDGYGPNPLSGGAQLYVVNGSRRTLLEEVVLDFDGKISDMAFAGCTSLISVTITDKVTRIGEMSFAGCVNLRRLTVPYVGTTKEFKFLVVEKGPDGTIYNSIGAYLWEIFGGRGLSQYGGGRQFSTLGSVEMESITLTGYNIWKEYDYETGETDGVYHYGFPHWAMMSAPANKVTISVDDDGGHEIEGQYGILVFSTAKVIDLKNSKISKAADGMFASTVVEEVTIPETLTVIPSYFFSNAAQLKKVIIPEGVKYLDTIVFSGTKNLYAVTFPSTIEGFWGGYGEKSALRTVYLTGAKQSDEYRYVQYMHEGETLIYVAVDSDVYAELLCVLDNNSWNKFFNTVFYVADVEFELKDASGKVLATKIEKHLAVVHDGAVLKYGTVASHSGDYWDIVDDYALPEIIGNFKVDNTKWTLDGNAVTTDTRLVGDKSKYVITQTLEAGVGIPIVPISVQKVYDGKDWTPYEGINVTAYNCTAGGNGFNNQWNKKPVDVGTYTVTATCASGYVWADAAENSSETRTFTLEITPVDAKLDWFYLFEGDQVATCVTGTVPSRVYNGYETRGNMHAEFTDVNGVKRTVSSSAFNLYAAGDRETNVPLLNAGLYDFVVYQNTNTADGQEWLGNYNFENNVQQFRITPYAIDLSEYGNLAWGLDGYNSYLLDRELFIYDDVPYAYEKAELGTATIRSVKGSVVRLRDADDLTIVIANIPGALYGDGKQYSATYRNNTASGVGIYTAEAVLTVADGNYEFVYGLGIDLLSRGISIKIDYDGKATITKVWYVVAMDNGMLNAAGEEYSITDWVYGEGTAIAAPRLEHGDEDTGYIDNNNVTFTLKLNGTTIVEDFTRSVFGNYINPSMPAGRYELICTVHNVTVGNHVHWWNDEEHYTDADNDIIYHGFTRTLIFNVERAEIEFNLQKGATGYANYEWKYDGDNKQGAFASFTSMINGNVVKLVQVERSGYWATSSAEKYFGGYAITYNLLRMNSETYLAADSYDLFYNIKGVGDYIVFFQIAAPNHNNLTDMGDERYGYFFTVTVYETLDTPVVSDAALKYTGSKVLPVLEESDLYEAVWNSDDNAYIAGGTHTVSFKLYDNVHYRWSDADGDTVSVDFVIGKADNAWTRDPNIINWTYENFNTKVNRIYAVSKFLDEGKDIVFTITKADGTAIAGLESFTVDNDGMTENAALIKALNGLTYGWYKLDVAVAETGNYLGITASIDFKIEKTINTWATGEEDLVLPSWIVGSYNEIENEIKINAAHGVVNIIVTDIDDEEIVYYKKINGEVTLDNLKDCEIGKYFVKAWVEETANYSELAERTFIIEVFKKAGMPWWGTLLIVIGALGVAALILWILHEKGVLQMLTGKIVIALRARMTVDATIAAVRANKRAAESKESIRKAEAQDRLEALRKAREEERNKSDAERAENLENKAKEEIAKAEKIQKRAETLQKRATRLKSKTGASVPEAPEATEAPEAAEPVEPDVAATDDTTNTADEE